MEENEGEGSSGEKMDKLIPDISMNVGDIPNPIVENEDSPNPEQNGDTVEFGGENNDEPMSQAPTDEMVDSEDSQNCNQIPEPYTSEEMTIQQQMFEKGTAVQFLRIHCTACNVHLGSAPNNQHTRYIHPLLKVIICKDCYTFYGSGDFDKDEDGSELYCRWCGQGGKVLCCSKCPYVFCQRCIRTNLGKKQLEAVKESDDWICLVCNPIQIVKVRVTCRALYEYIQAEIRLAEELKEPQRLSDDKSMCCRVRPYQPVKRKLSMPNECSSYNGTNDGDSHSKKKKIKSNILSHMLASKTNKFSMDDPLDQTWEDQVEDEVVCTPDLSMLIDDEESPMMDPSPTSPLKLLSLNPILTNGSDADVQYIGHEKLPNNLEKAPWPLLSPKNKLGYSLPNKPPIVLNTSTTMPLTTNSKTFNPSMLKLQKTSVGVSSQSNNVVNNMSISNESNTSVIKTAMPVKLIPGLKYDWFDKAIQFTTKVNQNLTNRINNLTKEQANISSLENLVCIHNSFQEILCNSINSLMEIRKNLRGDFVNGLKKLNFHKVKEKTWRTQNIDDNDVIIIDAPTNKTDNFVISNINTPSPYTLKKVEISKICSSSVITILDDNINEAQSEKEKFSSIQSTSNAAIADIVNTNEENKSDDLNMEVNEMETISENLSPETVVLINRALLESKFEKIINENLKYGVDDISEEELKQIISVRVVIETDCGSDTPRTLPYKNYRAISISCTENKVKADSVALESLDTNESERQQLNEIKEEDVLLKKTCDLSEELSQDPRTKDSGIDVDGDHNLNNEVINV